MNNEFHTIIAVLEAKPGQEQTLKDMLVALVKPTLEEEGCINFDLHQCPNNPARFMFYETWKDKEAHKKHSEAPHIQTFKEVKDNFLAKPYEVTVWAREM